MSAIFGLFDQQGINKSALESALNACASYGNDGCGLWSDGSIGLGHRLSHFTPESFGESQPYTSDGLTITADARIDNRAELLKTLEIANPSLPDSHLILNAYQRWGQECTVHLIGDFAFALWDSHQHILFCARDHVGARPFYYYAPSPCFFAFATSLDSLLAFPKVPTLIDEDVVADYLFNPLEVSVRQTFFKGIVKLPFGRQLCVTTQGVQERRYWEPRRQPLIRYKRAEEYAELVSERVSEAIACRLRTPLPIGAHVSGGLDSSSVAVIANRQLKQQRRSLTMSYSWSPPKSDEYPTRPGKDEREIIERLCHQEDLCVHFPDLTGEDQYAFQRQDIARRPVPFHSMELAVLRDAQQRGIRTILSGWGGDEGITFNGRGYFPWLFMTGRWWMLKKFIVRGSFVPKRWARRFLKHVALPLLPNSLYFKFMLSQIHMPSSLMHPNLATRLEAKRQIQRATSARDRTSIFKTQAALFEHGHLSNRLEAWSVWGATFGVTYSYPLLDRRVLELAYVLPAEAFLTLQGDRMLYRSAMDGILPDEIRNGRKDDPLVDERKRRLYQAVWQRLAQEAHSGLFEADSPWLDMPRFRAALTNVSKSDSRVSTFQFIRMRDALYSWDLWQLYASLSRAEDSF